MGRVVFLRGASLAASLALCACVGGGAGGADADVDEFTRDEVKEIVAHLSNDSRSERWREDLIRVGSSSESKKNYVIRVCRDEVERSLRHGGLGPGLLRPPGRRRTMEVAGRLGDHPEARSLLALGLEDRHVDIRLAAAAALASWGDVSTVPMLMEITLSDGLEEDELNLALQALQRLATPQNRLVFLNSLGPEEHVVLEAMVLDTFPGNPLQAAPELREVARSHASPYARLFALRALMKEEDPHMRELARRALDEGDPILRPLALQALGSAGGGDAVSRIEAELRRKPAGPNQGAVAGLYRVGSPQALRKAVELFQEVDLNPDTRGALARGFLGQVGGPKGPDAYRSEEARQLALTGLRAVVESEGEGPAVLGAIWALGRVGQPGTDDELLAELLQSPSPTMGKAVVNALGELGGELAAAKLVQLIESDATLRRQAAFALKKFSQPRDVPVDALIDLLEHDEPQARAAAIYALKGLSGADDPLGYEPQAPEGERAAGVEAWRRWWASHHNR